MNGSRCAAFCWILFTAFGMISHAGPLSADEEVKYRSLGKRDPFVSLVSSSAQTGGGFLAVESLDEIVVQGIVYDPRQGSIAMANGVFLKEGEESGNVKLVKVNPDGAVFLVNGVEGTKALYNREVPDKESN